MKESNVTCSISMDESTAIKGLLMLLIVMGHNLFFGHIVGEYIFDWLYSFHVALFFILPFFYPSHLFTWSRVKTLFARLYWPFIWAFTLLTAANYLMATKGIRPIEMPEYINSLSAGGFIRTMITGNFWSLSPYSGFYYLWFLPVMFSMLIIRDYFVSTSTKTVKYVLLGVAAVCFVFFWVFMYGTIDTAVKYNIMNWSPFAFLQGLGLFFLGYSCNALIRNFINLKAWVFLIVFIIMGVVYILIPKDTLFFSVYKIIMWSVNPFIAFGLIFCLRKQLAKFSFLKKIGALSLPIYIIHQPLNGLLSMMASKITISELFLFVLTYSIVLLVTYYITKFLFRTKIYSFLFPRNFPSFSKHNC